MVLWRPYADQVALSVFVAPPPGTGGIAIRKYAIRKWSVVVHRLMLSSWSWEHSRHQPPRSTSKSSPDFDSDCSDECGNVQLPSTARSTLCPVAGRVESCTPPQSRGSRAGPAWRAPRAQAASTGSPATGALVRHPRGSSVCRLLVSASGGMRAAGSMAATQHGNIVPLSSPAVPSL